MVETVNAKPEPARHVLNVKTVSKANNNDACGHGHCPTNISNNNQRSYFAKFGSFLTHSPYIRPTYSPTKSHYYAHGFSR